MKNKRIAYEYVFTFPDNKAGILLNIRPYKNGSEILFDKDDEIKADDYELSSVFKISFDPDTQFVIRRREGMAFLFSAAHGWDHFEVEITGYFLINDNEVNQTVSETEFRQFLEEHASDFDNPKNQSAYVSRKIFFVLDKIGEKSKQ